MISVKETPAYWKQFLYDALAMLRQLGILTYFLTSGADLRWEKRTHIINKLNNLELTDEELKNLSCQKRCNLLNHKPVFSACHLQYKAGVFFPKSSYLMVHWAKQNMLYVMDFKKAPAYMSIPYY